MKTTQSEITSATSLLPRLAHGQAVLGEGMWMRLFGPESRGWFRACHIWVQGGISPASDQASRALLSILPPHERAMASFFLECASLVINSFAAEAIPEDRIEQMATQSGLPPGLARDILAELATPEQKLAYRGGVFTGILRPPEGSCTLPVLLIDDRSSNPTGVVADLCLELIPRGTGRVYPVPALAFLRRDAAFDQAAQIALGRTRDSRSWPDNTDLRWSLSRRDSQPFGTLLLGNSLGGSFAFGLARLLTGENDSCGLGKLSLAGVAVSATIRPDSTLGSVGDILLKLVAAARERAFPRIHTVIVSADEQVDFPGLEEEPKGSNIFSDPLENFHLIKARTLPEAIDLLLRDQQERWHGIDCQLPRPDPDFTGRGTLFKRVRDFIETNDSGYLVLQGEMGIGKSAFMAALLHAERAAGNLPVYHLVSSNHTGSPEQIAACLYDRLRCKYRILEPSEWARFKVEVKLERLMLLLSEKLQAEKRKEVLYLEAADQTQLSPGQCLIPDYLGHLPPNFFFIVTSRFQTNWHKLHGQTQVCYLSEVIEAQADLRGYLRKKASQLDPPLEEDFIERIASQTPIPVFFTVVSCFRRLLDPATPAENRRMLRSDPALWAMAPKELIARELEHRLAGARQEGVSEDEFWLSLALLTVTGDDYLGAAQLEQLGVLTPERKAVLESCASFFQSRPTMVDPAPPYMFAHPGYIREIQEHAGPGRLRRCHELLARGSAAVLRQSEEIARGYALRHLPAHLRHAHDYDQLCSVLTDLDFLFEAFGVDAGRGALRNAGPPDLPPVNAFRLAYEFRKACEAVPESHPKHAELKGFGTLIDKHSHWLQEDPSLLPQLLYNDLAWRLDNHSPLGQRVRAAAQRQSRPWFKSLTPRANKQSAEPVRVLSGHTKSVLSVAFSPDGNALISGSADKTVRFWRGLGGESICLSEHKGPVNTVAFSPNGGVHFVTGSVDGFIIVWDSRSRKSIRRLEPGSGPILAMVFTPDGSTLISAGADGYLYFWDALNWCQLRKSGRHGAAVRSLAVSPDGKLVVSGGEDKTIRIWTAADGAHFRTIPEPDRWVEAVEFLDDNQTILSGGGFGCGDVKFWNLEGHCIRNWPEGHDEGIKVLAVSKDGLKLASGSYEGKVLVRNPRTGASYLPMGHTDRVEALAFSRDGKTLATACADRKILIWDIDGEPSVPAPPQARTIENAEPVLQGLAFVGDASLAIVCGKTSVLKLVETTTGKVRSVMHGQPNRDLTCVAACASQPLVVAGTFQQVRLWRLDASSSLRTLYGHSGWVLASTFSPDSKVVAAGGDDDNLILWGAESGTWLHTFHCQQSKVRSVAFSPDGRLLASGGEDGSLKIWLPGAPVPPRIFELHKAPVVAVAFAPRGTLLATGSEDESLRLLDYEAGILFPPMRLHRGAVTALAFSTDARWLASGGTDCTVRVWDTQTSENVAWTPCANRVLAVKLDGRPLQIRVADAGGADHSPGFALFELANLQSE